MRLREFSKSLGGFGFALPLLMAATAIASPVRLRTEHKSNPLGIDAARPVFSWQNDASTEGWMQGAYEVVVGTSAKDVLAGKDIVWDSGKVGSSDSVNIVYGGPGLRSQTRYFWRVRVWDGGGMVSTSAPAWFETGLLSTTDWSAKWIRPADGPGRVDAGTRWIWVPGADWQKDPSATIAEFRYRLHLDGAPLRADLHVLVHGEFEATVNGIETGHQASWAAFDWEAITPLLKHGKGAAGNNEIAIKVVSPAIKGASPFAPAGLAAVLQVRAQDGTERRIVSNRDWEVRSGSEGFRPAQEETPVNSGTVGGRETSLASGASLLRKDFMISGTVRSARLTITALGAYRAFLNGKAVEKQRLLDPGFTDFRRRVLYQTYDVTALVGRGENRLGAMLGAGWHGSPMTWLGVRMFPGPELLRAQLDVALADGTHQRIVTDESWKTADAPILSSTIYAGEVYDARMEKAGWSAGGLDDKAWTSAKAEAVSPELKVTAQPDLPIHLTNVLHAISVRSVPNVAQGRGAVFDMGQNMVGNIMLHVHGPRGTQVRMRFAERLNPDGTIYTENLRNATATDVYVLSGRGEENYTPSFTFHGFRYVELMGYPGTPTAGSLEGLVYNSLPAKPSIRFSSSSAVLSKMAQLGIWGQRGNFVSIPTDCPQRDERLGWMGDAGAFWRTGSYNFDIASFTDKFMADVEDAQAADGAFSDISPDVLARAAGAPGWADAGVLVPYAAWLQYGDKQLLARAWPSMERFMEFIARSNPDHLRRNQLGANYGDWLAPDPNTSKDLIGTAYWALLARDMREMALALERKQDAERYEALYGAIAQAYQGAYVKQDGSVAGNTQSAYAATLYAGLAPEKLRAEMTRRLVANIAAHGDHLTTGFLGTPLLMFALDENQRADVAFKLLLQKSYPSWGYMVVKDATTWWERWNGDTGDPKMNSYNHYAFGSVMAWVFRRAAGIDTDASGAGFHHLAIAPHFDASLPKLHAEYDSMYGTISTDWDRASSQFTVITPANTIASVSLPDGRVFQAGSGRHSYMIH